MPRQAITDSRKVFLPSDLVLNVSKKGFVEVSNKKGYSLHSFLLPVEDDYLILWQEENKSKKFLGKVRAVKGQRIEVLHEATAHTEEPEISVVDLNSILFNLGKNPRTELTIAGVKIQRFYETIKTKLGPLHIFRDTHPSEKKKLTKAIKQIEKEWFEEIGLPSIFPIELHLLEPRGKYAGYYKYMGGKEDKVDILAIFPSQLKDANITHILWHELGHGIQSQLFSQRMNASWMKNYIKYTRIMKQNGGLVSSLLGEFLSYGEDVYDHVSDEERELLNDIFGIIDDKTTFDFDALVSLQRAKKLSVIRDVWPDDSMISSREHPVTEYGSKNWQEHWCESLAHWRTPSLGIRIQEPIEKLLIKTLSKLSKN